MAVTSIWPIKGRVDSVIRYVRNPEKTREQADLAAMHEIDGVVEYAADDMKTETRSYVTCINLQSEETAAREFMETKRFWHNEGGRLCYHGYQSFKADEVDAETAHRIGVRLAREMWGDRFQVVVATHCNTGHYHNHFVINSVSDADGKKFYNFRADYLRMREISDRICREEHISVIEDPGRRGRNHGEWQAEKSGKPTIRGTIRADIDRAILASTTERHFMQIMAKMGYRIETGTKTGERLKYPKLKPPGAKGWFRFHNLGEGYDLDSVKERIQRNIRRRDPFPEYEEKERSSYYRYREKAKKAKGLKALYLYYCYQLHIIKAHPAAMKKVQVFLREDVAKLDRYIAQSAFLEKTGIETMKELTAYQEEQEGKKKELEQRRQDLRNRLKRLQREAERYGGIEYSPQELAEKVDDTKKQIAALSRELGICRKEISLCRDIAVRSEQVERKLEEIQHSKEIERKEAEQADGLRISRSGRTGREDEPGRAGSDRPSYR